MSVVGPYMLCNGIYSTHKLLTTPEHESSFDYLDPHFVHNIHNMYNIMHTVHKYSYVLCTNQPVHHWVPSFCNIYMYAYEWRVRYMYIRRCKYMYNVGRLQQYCKQYTKVHIEYFGS